MTYEECVAAIAELKTEYKATMGRLVEQVSIAVVSNTYMTDVPDIQGHMMSTTTKYTEEFASLAYELRKLSS